MTTKTKRYKVISTENYNLLFDSVTGFTARWGRTQDEDPEMCPIGPEILDVEVSTICRGIGASWEKAQPCSWCYKSNTNCGTNMSLETFKTVLSRFPDTVTQIALGIGDIDSNPDLFPIMQHCRDNGVVPNLTTNGMKVEGEIAKTLASLAGAIAVSHYGLDDVCFNAIKNLTDNGLLHKVLVRKKRVSSGNK